MNFDAIVIGTGQAGPPMAARLAGTGRKIAVVERHLFGGTCVNTGCMPTKTMVASARALHMAGAAPISASPSTAQSRWTCRGCWRGATRWSVCPTRASRSG